MIQSSSCDPVVKRGKNDAADAGAPCEAMSRPTMRFLPVQSAELHMALRLGGMGERAIAAQRQLANAIRVHAAESGLTAAKVVSHRPLLLARIMADEDSSDVTRDLLALLADECAQWREPFKETKARPRTWCRSDECCRRPRSPPRRRADRCGFAGDESACTGAVQIRKAVCCDPAPCGGAVRDRPRAGGRAELGRRSALQAG
ncbi:hypothetical protein [Mangrovicoccus ximenensis]|uniref:hypothetical protein n=1 Tax=Mangrovicoccus ximenensis TaxID=1911570 RepID=UPI001F18D535|nr:hypothetical protein [Mangrovicoccus ximenensis]